MLSEPSADCKGQSVCLLVCLGLEKRGKVEVPYTLKLNFHSLQYDTVFANICIVAYYYERHNRSQYVKIVRLASSYILVAI